MQKKAQVRLTTSWAEVRRHLPQKLVTAVEPHLQLPVGVSANIIVFPIFEFDVTDPLLAQLLEAMEKVPTTTGPFRLFSFLFGKPVEPLLQHVLYFDSYELIELLKYPFVQVVPTHTLSLRRPLRQYYQAQIKRSSDCSSCGQVQLTQIENLQLAEKWPDGCFVAETDNYEFLITNTLKEVWQRALPTEELLFQQVKTNHDKSEQIWQVVPKYIFPIAIPPTAIQVLELCPTCQRPLTLTPRQSDPAVPTHETEASLYSNYTHIPSGNFWKTKLLQGRVRLSHTLLEKHNDDPDPSFARTARPFWIASNQLLDQFQQYNVQDWIGKPVLSI